MNELKIIITAANSAAKKAVKEVRDEIEKTSKSAKENGKSISDSMKTIAKGAAIATTAIAAVTTALVAFGKSTLEAQKHISKLNTAFLAAGSTTKQAGETYKNLYRFMGDSGAATEAAQQLALITTNEKDLAQWTKILQGVYATMGSTLPIESLAEAANETINVGKVTGVMADALNWAKVSEDGFNAALAQTNTYAEREALVRSTLNSLYINAANIYERNNQALLANYQSQASLNIALANAGRAVLPLMTAVNNLATSLLTVLRPALEVVSQILAIFVGYIAAAVKWVVAFFSIFTGGNKAKDTTKEVANNVSAAGKNAKVAAGGVGSLGGALNKAASAAKELKKQTMGFDELNIVSSQTSTSSDAGGGGAAGGGGVGGIDIPDLSGLTDISEFTTGVEDAKKKAEGIVAIIGSIAAALALWKVADFIIDLKTAITELPKVKELVEMTTKAGYDPGILKETQDELQGIIDKAKLWGGLLMVVAGAILLVQGYSDAWVNGIDWANLGVILAGISLIVGGLALAFGPLVAGVAAIAGGIALLVLGIKDFVTNGYSMEAVLTILAGVIAIVVGVCLAFNAALLANPITWIVIGIAALVAAFVILWNECEGFRNFWIELWEKVKELFAAFLESIQPAVDAFINMFNEAWELLKVIWNDYLVPLFKLAWEAIKIVWDAVKPYFETIWNNIKTIFSVVKDILGSFFKAGWEVIKAIWDVVVAYFKAIWDSIAGIFSVVKNVLQGNWQGAWDAIKGIVGTWKEFFSTVWESIKKIFSAVGTFFKEIFSTAWTGIKNVFSNWGSFFSGLWDKIKSTFSALGTTLGDAIGGAVKNGINKVIGWIESTINKAIGLINGAIDLINKLPGVNVGKLSTLTLPKLAKGGVVDSATIAMIGEAGKEAVVPLENNTGWMDKLAERLAAKSQTPSKIILKVGEKELGWATIGAINGITEQTGGLQLVL